MMPLISVVIPTRDSERHIGACLDSLDAQTMRDFEVIVVDGGSADGTSGIASSRAKLLVSRGSLPSCRNMGFASAKGAIFLSIDSDMVLEGGLLADIAARMGGNGALVIPELGCGKGLLPRLKALEKECYLGDPMIESARAFSREAFEAVGGYDERLHFGEDRDLHSRIAARFPIGRTQAKVKHDTSGLSLAADLGKACKYGKTLSEFASKDRAEARSWLGLRFLFPWRYRKTLASRPLEAAALLALKTAEHAAGLCGYLAAKAGL